MRFLGGPQVRSVAWRSFVGLAGSWPILGFGIFSVIEKDGGRWVGRVGTIRPEGWPGTEVGWSLIRDVWGRGYAVEAVLGGADVGESN